MAVSAKNVRALTRNCESRRNKNKNNKKQSREEEEEEEDKRNSSPLSVALLRSNVLVYGAPWCKKCREQKRLLARLVPNWQRHYCDVSLAKNAAQSIQIRSVPTWQVRGKRFPGVFETEEQIGELIGLTHASTRANSRTSCAGARRKDDDILGGAKLRDLEFGNVSRQRRHLRKGAWSKRKAISLALRNEGRFWCEFGELKTEKIERLLKSNEPLMDPM